MARLIDADALRAKLDELGWTVENGFQARIYIDSIIDNTPTVEPERQKGEWTNKHFEHADCSLCDRTNDYHGDFCKYCGADMRKEKKND